MNQVTILDHDFEVIRKIDHQIEISEFKIHWDLFEPIKSLPNYKWTHKIDIRSDGKFSVRWLYNKEGYIARLNKQLKPMYRVKNVQEFNLYLLRAGI